MKLTYSENGTKRLVSKCTEGIF